jgi:DNA (cytosine-5)-methyltransferase 1
MTHGSLFSGIGGFDLAAEWAGWQNIFNCEWEEFPRKVLKHHFPNAKQYEDIREFNATDYAGRIDILSGGFPCQPYSTAGKRLGKEDERHLWPEMLRVIRECSPRWVVGENVRGLVNWSGGLVFEEVCADLEACGYSVQPFVLPACAVNAPHRRDRVWFVAQNTNCNGRRSNKREKKSKIRGFGNISAGDNERIQTNIDEAPNAPDTDNARTNEQVRNNGNGQKENKGRKKQSFAEFGAGGNNAPDTECDGLEHGSQRGSVSTGEGKARERTTRYIETEGWTRFPTESPICGGDDGLPRELDGITFPKWRAESIKAYGNAIVPQVAYQIFQAINQYENDQP